MFSTVALFQVEGAMGPLQAEQIEQLKDIFSSFDMDSDGSLTHLELAALLRSLGKLISNIQ